MIAFVLVCLAALGLSEFFTVTVLLAPRSQSTPTDWLIGAGLIAPFTAAVLVWAAGLVYRITADLHTLWRWIATRRVNNTPPRR